MKMAVEPEIETQFNGLELLMAKAPFDEAKAAIEAPTPDGRKGSIATVQHVAEARISEHHDPRARNLGSAVAENLIYCPDGKIYITSKDYSPILKHASEATEAHRQGNEFYISKNELEEIVKVANEDIGKKAEERRVYILKKTDGYGIPVKDFAKDELVRFLFKDTAEKYAYFLQTESIVKKVYVSLPSPLEKPNKPFAWALWFHGLNGRSALLAGRNLNCSYGLRGVREVASKS